MDFDERTSRHVEAVYTTPDVVEQRRLVIEALDLKAGEHVLDIGSGPGFLACEMAAVVGEVRGRGLMLAFELVEGGAPDLVSRALAEERLVLNATGPTTVRLLPPLIIDRAQADDALQRLGRLLA